MKKAKFVQIATAVIGDYETLYALDEAGRVWWYDSDDCIWRTTSEARSK